MVVLAIVLDMLKAIRCVATRADQYRDRRFESDLIYLPIVVTEDLMTTERDRLRCETGSDEVVAVAQLCACDEWH